MSKLELCFDVPEGKRDCLIECYAIAKGWKETTKNEAGETIKNPETKAAFAKRLIWQHIIRTAHRGEEEKNRAERIKQTKAALGLE